MMVSRRTVVHIPTPPGVTLHRVEFYSDHIDPRPVGTCWPLSYPFWITGSYSFYDKIGDEGEGYKIIAITHDIELTKKAWPEHRELNITGRNIPRYTFTSLFSPNDDVMKTLNVPCERLEGMLYELKWPIIVKAFQDAGVGEIEEIPFKGDFDGDLMIGG